jgi:hypothetical protein
MRRHTFTYSLNYLYIMHLLLYSVYEFFIVLFLKDTFLQGVLDRFEFEIFIVKDVEQRRVKKD